MSRLTRAMVLELTEAMDPQRQGAGWPDPIRWDGRSLDEQARDLLALVQDDVGDVTATHHDPRVAKAAAQVRAALRARSEAR